MLVLTRKCGEKLRIAQEIVVTVLEVKGQRVRLGIEAPLDVSVLREELCRALADGTARPEAREGRRHAVGNS
jgi:carbon storage regulator